MDILILILATWRLSRLFARERGPFEMFEKFRHFVGVRFDDTGGVYYHNEFAEGLHCVWCNSIWFSVALTLGCAIFADKSYSLFIWLVMPFGLSAGAIIVEEAIEKWRELVQ